MPRPRMTSLLPVDSVQSASVYSFAKKLTTVGDNVDGTTAVARQEYIDVAVGRSQPSTRALCSYQCCEICLVCCEVN